MGILKQQIKNTGFYRRKWSLSDTYGPEKPHKIIVGSFKNTVSTTFQKVAPGRGPELHFGCFWAPKIRQNSKKCSPKRNQKMTSFPGCIINPGEGGHTIWLSGPGQGVPGLRRRSSPYKPRPGMSKKTISDPRLMLKAWVSKL